MKYLLLLFISVQVVLCALHKYPADITFMVADLKYSKANGVKICEIQHGILSKYKGDAFLNPPHGNISCGFEQFFAEFPQKKWTFSWQFVSQPLVQTLRNAPLWVNCLSDAQLFKDPEFLACAKRYPQDPSDISTYPCMMYARPEVIKNYEMFQQEYPGVLVIDAPSHKYWSDKHAMTLLFTGDDNLVQIKPEWGVYPKQYHKGLASQIINDIPGDIFVIKPRGAFLGKGVIIVAKDALDSTLKYILTESKKRANDPDPSYNYWHIDEADSFIVEKYYQSDSKIFQDKPYDPTMRAAFIFMYNKGKIEMRFLSGYWILPELSLNDAGSLNQCRKSFGQPPMYLRASKEELEAVEAQCLQALPLMYEKMLLAS